MSGKAPAAERILRSLWTDMALGMSWTLIPERLRGIRDAVHALVHENNVMRRNNERLRRRLQDAEDMNDTLRGMLKDANSANTTAQTMAEHWRLKAQGGNYDAQREAEEAYVKELGRDQCGGCGHFHLNGTECWR